MSSVGDNVWWNKDDEDISLAPADPRIAQFEVHTPQYCHTRNITYEFLHVGNARKQPG